eukprot:12777920-Alexandrium_andersonii.AAC.1
MHNKARVGFEPGVNRESTGAQRTVWGFQEERKGIEPGLNKGKGMGLGLGKACVSNTHRQREGEA